MPLTDHEKQLAANALRKMRDRMSIRERIHDPSLSPEDRALMEKYPRHTLEAARFIDSCPRVVETGQEDAFYKIRIQETHQPRP